MANFMQRLVSKKKKRFTEDGFDLDMTFITERIVAMGFPAESLEGVYRNKMTDVKRFFDGKYRDHYKVYNLCSERGYVPEKFYGRVANYPFPDHNAPPFVLMKPFCEDVAHYLDEDPRNVALIHCKAGKGRTGVMICAFLLHCGRFAVTQEALDFYGNARTSNGKGVTIPSQLRFVEYYGRSIQQKMDYQPTTLIFKTIRLVGVPNIQSGTCQPFFTIRQGPEQVLIFKSQVFEGIGRDAKEAVLLLDPPTPICGDVKVEFFHKTKTGKEKMFHLWFNSFFVDNNVLIVEKKMVDKANKDKKHKIYPQSFAVELQFESPEKELRRATQAHAAGKEAEAKRLAGRAEFTEARPQEDTVGGIAGAHSADAPSDDGGETTDDDDDPVPPSPSQPAAAAADEFAGLPITNV